MKILITGGNRGIGAEMAARYRAEGHEVLATAHTKLLGNARGVAKMCSM